MKETKKLKGVTILGVLIIIGSVLNLLSAPEGWKYNLPISNYLYLIIMPLSIVIAAFLFRLKNWARIAIIVISSIALVETLLTASYGLNKVKEYDMSRFERSFYAGLEAGKQHARPEAPKVTEQQIEEFKQKAMVVYKKGMLVTVIIMILLGVMFNLVLICYFTRPKVKEQFR